MPVNVFVLCTGRCGSTTFIEACSHISNFTSAHESRTAQIGRKRFAYPPRHIEADNRLAWLLGRLDRAYGDRPFYVHLKRDLRETAASFANRYDVGMLKAYRGRGILLGLRKGVSPMSVARDYCNTVNSNIEAFLKDKSKVMQFRLENGKEDFLRFCSSIDAEVDVDAALAEFDTRHNASAETP
ncbi:MAG: hypothetical protein ACT4PZ_03940 [Panacagrimonas sp.]